MVPPPPRLGERAQVVDRDALARVRQPAERLDRHHQHCHRRHHRRHHRHWRGRRDREMRDDREEAFGLDPRAREREPKRTARATEQRRTKTGSQKKTRASIAPAGTSRIGGPPTLSAIRTSRQKTAVWGVSSSTRSRRQKTAVWGVSSSRRSGRQKRPWGVPSSTRPGRQGMRVTSV